VDPESLADVLTLSVSLNTCFGIAGCISDEIASDTGMGGGVCGANGGGIHGRIIGIFGSGTAGNAYIHHSRSTVY